MLNRLKLFVVLGSLTASLVACGELGPAPKPADEPAKADTPKPAAAEGPFYELTKDEITSHPDWTSRNIMAMGMKIGDKTVDKNVDLLAKNFGPQLGDTKVLAEEYLTYYQKNSIGIYSFKLTGKIKRIEVFQSFADRIADPKLKGLLSSGDLKQMRAIFGMEEGMEDKPEEKGTEYVYDAKGIRVIKYMGGNVGLRFSELKK
jgi:predicted small lipoprotein YifL